MKFPYTLLMMHLTALLITICCIQVSAAVYSQQINLAVKEAPLREVLQEIRKQSGYAFLFKSSYKKHAHPVTVNLKEAELTQALNEIFRHQSFRYRIEGKTIVVEEPTKTPAAQKPTPNEKNEVGLQQPVRGVVLDEEGKPLSGATVRLKGAATAAVVTGQDGSFLMADVPLDATLIITYTGYESKEIKASDDLTAIRLTPSDSKLDEVVVIGYGAVRKRDLTGSVASVDAEQFKNQPMTQLTDMLSGTVAGFSANQNTSAAGGNSMEIRGPTSLSAGNSPMVVLDGVVYNGSISDINPIDVESVDILKDASSAAVFGAKAASGVILITTSKGRTGKPTINFSAQVGRAEVTNREFGPYDGPGYLDFRRDMFRFIGNNLPSYYYFSPNELPEGVTLEQWRSASGNPNDDNTLEWLNRLNLYPTEQQNYLAGKSINWFDEVMNKGLRQNYDLSIGGGSENTKYYWSIGYTNNEGIVTGDQFSAVRSRLNADFKVAKWLSVGMNTQFSNRDESTVQANLSTMAQVSPYGSMFEADGRVKWYPGDYIIPNPLMNYYGQDRDRKINNLFSSLYADLRLPFGITHRVSFQPRFQNLRDYNFWSTETLTGGQTYPKGRVTRQDQNAYGWMLDNLLKWNKEFGVHNFDLTLLQNAEFSRGWISESTNITFQPSPILGFHGIQFGTNPTVNSLDDKATGDALMARLNYTLLGKYLFTASVRRDGYSAFGQQNPRATFPAAAVAWNLSDESFFNVPWVDQLKLRLSWGVNGNRDIGSYAALAQLASNLYYDGSNLQVGLENSTLSNPRLRWEKTTSTNLGLDANLFNGRLSLTADYYEATTTDLLMSRLLPRITGFNSIMTNLGELRNRGLELTINSINVKNEQVQWRSEAVFSFNRNKIVHLFGDYEEVEVNGQTVRREVPDYSNKWFPGQAVDVVWDYNFLGIWQQEEAEAAAAYRLVPGDIKATDVDNSGTYEALEDKMFIGYSQPRYRLGLRNDVSFLKNFSASMFVRADLDFIGDMPEAIHSWSTYDRNSTWNIPYWTAENRENEWPRLTQDNAPFGGGIMLYKPRSFVRIQDLSLAYTFSSTLLKRVSFSSARIYVAARNLYSFDHWPGWDPESKNLPMPRTYTLGLNIAL